MKTSFYASLLLAFLALSACKPTPRTANDKHDHAKQETTQSGSTGESTPPASTVTTSSSATSDTTASSASPQQTTQVDTTRYLLQVDTTRYLLEVSTTRQAYSLLHPWEKESAHETTCMGVYLGDNKVLTYGKAVESATYIEMRLPDGSMAVPAQILSYNADLNLALLTVAHEADAAIFSSRQALPLGEPLAIGNTAELWSTIQGVTSAQVPVQAESSLTGPGNILCLNLKATAPIPGDSPMRGLPIVRDGKLSALTLHYNQESRALIALNAELIGRFLSQTAQARIPLLGITYTGVDDPVFRRYLQLSEQQGGLYITEVAQACAARDAGVQPGDVLTSIEDMPLDSQGRCRHPLYGTVDAAPLLRILKPTGGHLRLTICRHGETQELNVPLNRDASDKALIGEQSPGEQPRYILYGGLLFQPLTDQYIQAIMEAANGSLPLHFLELEGREEELRAEGRKELVALTLVIPTPATLSYEDASFCLVEKINGKVITDFAHFAELLDTPTDNGLITFSLNKPPYTIALDRGIAEASNRALQAHAIPVLRVPAPAPAPTSEPQHPSPAPGSTAPANNGARSGQQSSPPTP